MWPPDLTPPSVPTLVPPNAEVQMVVMDCPLPPPHVVTNPAAHVAWLRTLLGFDLPALENVFDGHSVYVCHPRDVVEGVTRLRDNVMYDAARQRLRCEKYAERGLSVLTDHLTPDTQLHVTSEYRHTISLRDLEILQRPCE